MRFRLRRVGAGERIAVDDRGMNLLSSAATGAAGDAIASLLAALYARGSQ